MTKPELAVDNRNRSPSSGKRANWLHRIVTALLFGAVSLLSYWVWSLRLAIEVPVLVDAIVAFDSDSCPSGWEEAKELAGRVVIGSGFGDGLTPRAREETGGEESVKLDVSQMPSHSHMVRIRSQVVKPHLTGNNDSFRVATGSDVDQTLPSGMGGSHNNMPPYIAQLYCRKK